MSNCSAGKNLHLLGDTVVTEERINFFMKRAYKNNNNKKDLIKMRFYSTITKHLVLQVANVPSDPARLMITLLSSEGEIWALNL